MAKILFIHGMCSDSYLPLHQLKGNIRKENLNYLLPAHEVSAPILPGAGVAKQWLPLLEKLPIESYDLVIGHSTGANAVMKLAEKYRIKNLLIMGGTFTTLCDPSEKATGWFDHKWEWGKIQENCKGNVYQVANLKDPEISPRQSQLLHKYLNSVYYEFNCEATGHFSSWFKYDQLGPCFVTLVTSILEDNNYQKEELRS